MNDLRAGGFVPVTDEQSGKLLFRYDPERDLVELMQRGERKLIDLREYQAGGRLAAEPRVRRAESGPVEG